LSADNFLKWARYIGKKIKTPQLRERTLIKETNAKGYLKEFAKMVEQVQTFKTLEKERNV
jgi:hypothetical protein